MFDLIIMGEKEEEDEEKAKPKQTQVVSVCSVAKSEMDKVVLILYLW